MCMGCWVSRLKKEVKRRGRVEMRGEVEEREIDHVSGGSEGMYQKLTQGEDE